MADACPSPHGELSVVERVLVKAIAEAIVHQIRDTATSPRQFPDAATPRPTVEERAS